MKKITAFLFLMFSTAATAFAHNMRGNLAHTNPHWLPGVLCIGALAVFIVAFAISLAINNRKNKG